MKNTKCGVLAIVVGAGIAFSATNAMAQMSADSGWYLGGTIGQSDADVDCSGTTSCDTKDTAWRILGGYQINRNFAVEVGYHNLGEVSASAPGVSVNLESNAWELVGIGAFPISNQFSIYGKAGFYRGETEVEASVAGVGSGSLDETNTDLTYGIGAQYKVNRQLGIRAEWQRYTNLGDNGTIGEADVDVMSVGLIWRFQ
jgi:OOP family OmpA-OmpF porin